MRRLARALARRRFVLSPTSPRDLEALAGPGAWRASGPEPTFQLASSRARLPSGWVRLAIEIMVTEGDSALGWMLADTGHGFADARRVRVPRAASGKVFQTVRLPDAVSSLRYDPIKGEGAFVLGRIEAQEVSWPEVLVRQMLRYCRGAGQSPLAALRFAAVHVRVHGWAALWSWIRQYLAGEQPDRSYGAWAARNDTWTADRLGILHHRARTLARRPKFSIVMPVYDTPVQWLRKAIDSVLAQAYGEWELCICDDNSSQAHVAAVLEEYRRADPRIKVVSRAQNGHIAVSSNDAMRLMTGEYMCLLDHDDELAPHALYAFARALDADPSIDLLYSDEDLISIDGVRYEPLLKPAWSPENLESFMYLGHLTCYRADLARELGGFRPEFSGTQDYDLALRYAERARNVRHIPEVLYHWRAVPGSIAVSIEKKEYVLDAARRAIEDRLRRGGDTGTVVERPVKGWFETRRDVAGEPLVSIVVTHAGLEAMDDARASGFLQACVDAIRAKSAWRNHEILVGTREGDVNRAVQLNALAARADGEYLVFVNGDTRIITSDWLEGLLRHAQRPGVGAVGAKLLFRDNTLRHAGIAFCDGLPRHIRQGYPASDWGYQGSSVVARNCLAVSGACMMVSREAFEAALGFDPAMAPAWHDVDLCLRLIERGRRNVYAAGAVLHQLGNDFRGGHPALDAMLRERWRHLTTPDPYYGANLTTDPPTFEFNPAAGVSRADRDRGRTTP